MTQLVTVQTDFVDLEQMAEGLTGRVHATHVILPAGDAVDEGEWAQFEIALHDGSAGLAGIGRCVTVVDNGDERAAHQRFDVVFDSLQFDTHEQQVFEHILALHGTGGQQLEEVADVDAESLPPQTTEDTGAFVDVSTEFTGSQQVHVSSESIEPEAVEHDDMALDPVAGVAHDDTDDDENAERTMIASVDELEPAGTDAMSMNFEPGGEDNDAVPHTHLATPVRTGNGSSNGASYGHARSSAAHAVQPLIEEGFEEPLSGERIAPTPRVVNGAAFAYTNGIPFPAKPPRPDLEPALRVTPAPRPAGSASH
ncbi:MAG: hypothetical protein RLZZ450_1922 [Pseudomonadota bacterium]|jgi:hypothetical protein